MSISSIMLLIASVIGFITIILTIFIFVFCLKILNKDKFKKVDAIKKVDAEKHFLVGSYVVCPSCGTKIGFKEIQVKGDFVNENKK